jgi:hypothetical protein
VFTLPYDGYGPGYEDPYILNWIIDSLEEVCGDNRIEEITIILSHSEASRGTRSEVSNLWLRLDFLLAQPFGFPLLRKLSLLTRSFSENPGEEEKMKVVPYIELPLLDAKGIVVIDRMDRPIGEFYEGVYARMLR